jgi:predicted alpha/beta-fold hydrolase
MSASTLKEFEAHGWLRNAHLQTIAGTFLRRKFLLPEGEERLFRVDAETQLKGICHWQRGKPQGSRTCPDQSKDWPLQGQREDPPAALHEDCPRDMPVIVIVHGLEGSSDSNYVRGIADKAWARGFHAVRMNQRNCGGTERLTPTLYNSGLSGDYRAVLLELIAEGFEQIYFAGYSMGGNLVTKMAGEWGAAPPKELRGVCAVCPALDLSACADALEETENYLYQRHFVKGLMSRYRRKVELFPERYTRDGFGPIRTVREFDDEITAPYFGFKDAEDYYEHAGAKCVLAQMTVPMLVITAKDDPFVPYEALMRAGVDKAAAVRFVASLHGGHCGFISRWEGKERFWAEERVVEFVEERSNERTKTSPQR